MNNNTHRPPAALDLVVDALLAAPAGGLVLVAGGTASGKSTVATALVDQLTARVEVETVGLSDDNFVRYLTMARDQTDVAVLWDEIRDRVSFMLFLAHTRQRFTVGVIHAPDQLGVIRNLQQYASHLPDDQRATAINAVRERLVAVIETSREHEPAVITPVPWP